MIRGASGHGCVEITREGVLGEWGLMEGFLGRLITVE